MRKLRAIFSLMPPIQRLELVTNLWPAPEDVRVDGLVVLPKGTAAKGTVLFARRKGNARSGALDLRVDVIDTPDAVSPDEGVDEDVECRLPVAEVRGWIGDRFAE